MEFSRPQGALGVRQLALNLIRISVILNQQIMWIGASAPTLSDYIEFPKCRG